MPIYPKDPHTAPDLEREAKLIADFLRPYLGRDRGVTVFVFDYKEGGDIAYVSTARRPEMIRAIREWLAQSDPVVASS